MLLRRTGILPSLRRASPSAPCNENLDLGRCVSIAAYDASTYQMYHSDTFVNSLSDNRSKNPRFAPQPDDQSLTPEALGNPRGHGRCAFLGSYIQPGQMSVSAKPRELALGELASADFHQLDGFCQRSFAAQV